MELSTKQELIHSRAVELSREHRKVEWKLVEALIAVESAGVAKTLEYSSLFVYALKELKLSRSVAYYFISVARSATKFAPLHQALKTEVFPVAKASRMVSALTDQNVQSFIDYAKTCTYEELDSKVANENPKARRKASVKPISADEVRFSVDLPKATLDKLKRAQNLMSKQQVVDFAVVIDAAVEQWLEKNDPVRKAERAKPPTELCAHRVPTKKRMPLTAAEKYAVFRRDGGRCTFRDASGDRCENERWLHVHHIKLVSQGGGNEIENLATVCSTHHDLIHQLSLPIEGQIKWIRAPQRAYFA